LFLLALGDELFEHRALIEPRAHVHGEDAERCGYQEGDPPTPAVEDLRPHERLERSAEDRAREEAGERAELQETTVEAALLVRRVLCHERRGSAVLAARCEALHDP